MKRFFLLLIGIGLGAAIAGIFVMRQNSSEPAESNQTPTAQVPKQIDLEGEYLFSGTVVIARAVERLAVDSAGRRDFAQPFSGLESFEPQRYDAWGVDFECPITDRVIPYQTQIDQLVFNCPPEFLPEMTRYFNLFNLANNHTGDAGAGGFAQTRTYIETAGAQHYGNFDPTVHEDIGEIIGLPIRVSGSSEKLIFPIAFCSLHLFNYNRLPTDQELAEITIASKHFPVFAFVEMGAEYRASATTDQEIIARSMIDAGAEFVFANNPHWVQNAEVYKGKLIVYSLGNFIFDQIEAETLRGVSIAVSLRIENLDESWLEVANTCQPTLFKDTCFSAAESRGLVPPQLKLTYTPIANTSGYRKITQKADDATQAAVRERLGWEAVLEALAVE